MTALRFGLRAIGVIEAEVLTTFVETFLDSSAITVIVTSFWALSGPRGLFIASFDVV